MRTINEQLSDISTGAMTADAIISEGVNDYAIKYYEPATMEELRSLKILKTAYENRNAITKKVICEEPELVKCACGCTVPKINVMSASFGTSCPDCYDRMSDI